MSSEQEILDEITAVESMQKSIRVKLSSARMEVIENESLLITAKLKLDKLQEELRVWRLQSPVQPPTQRDLDIAAFRENLPDLMKRIK